MLSIRGSDCWEIVHAAVKLPFVFSAVEPVAVVGMREGCCGCCSVRIVWLRWAATAKAKAADVAEVLVAVLRDGGMIVKWNRVAVLFGNLDGCDTPLRCGDGRLLH